MSEVLVINMCLVFKVYHVKEFIQQLLMKTYLLAVVWRSCLGPLVVLLLKL